MQLIFLILIILFTLPSCSQRMTEDQQWAYYVSELKKSQLLGDQIQENQRNCKHIVGFKEIYRYDKEGVETSLYQCPDCLKWFEMPYDENGHAEYVNVDGNPLK